MSTSTHWAHSHYISPRKNPKSILPLQILYSIAFSLFLVLVCSLSLSLLIHYPSQSPLSAISLCFGGTSSSSFQGFFFPLFKFPCFYCTWWSENGGFRIKLRFGSEILIFFCQINEGCNSNPKSLGLIVFSLEKKVIFTVLYMEGFQREVGLDFWGFEISCQNPSTQSIVNHQRQELSNPKMAFWISRISGKSGYHEFQ